MSKKWRVVLLGVLIITTIPLVLLITNLGFKVSFLWTVNGNKNCELVSSDGKWVACDPTDHSITIISTKFPFRKIEIDLPKLDAEKGDAYFRHYWYDKWSPQGSNLYVRISSGPMPYPLSGFCILNINDDGKYQINCIRDESGSDISFDWATTGENGFIKVPIDNATYAISLYHNDGSLLKHFIISRTDSLLEGEEIGVTYFIWDGANNIYQWVGYQKKSVEGEVQPSFHRTEIYRISVQNPIDSEKIFGGEKYYSLVSIDPSGQKLLLVDNTEMHNRSLLIFDIKTRNFIDAISVDIKREVELYFGYSFCLESCEKTGIILHPFGKSSQVLIWSWSNSSYNIYPAYSIVGKLDYLDGFLCVNNNTQGKKIHWVYLCK